MTTQEILKNCIIQAITGDVLYRCWTALNGYHLVIRESMGGPLRAYVMEYNNLLSISAPITYEQPICHLKLTQKMWNKSYFTKGWAKNREGVYIAQNGRKYTWNELLREVSERDNTPIITKLTDELLKCIKPVHEKNLRNYIRGIYRNCKFY